ncbi:MAG TPA: PIN domain-containing protein [bacterium]|nr:PIN domain-containing protein [bacterium]
MAIDILFELIEKGRYNLVWSFILEYENSRNPSLKRRLHINSISTLCSEIIKPDAEIKSMARAIVESSNAKDKDALHLASAIYGGCNYFITCDDRFIRTVERNRKPMEDVISKIKLYNPIDFLGKEMDINVVE